MEAVCGTELSHSQSQARLTFLNCFWNGQLGLHQNQCTLIYSQKIHSLSTGEAHSQVEAYIVSPPYVGKQHTEEKLTYIDLKQICVYDPTCSCA